VISSKGLAPLGQALPKLAAEGGHQGSSGGLLLDAVHQAAGLQRLDGLADTLGTANVPGILALLLRQGAYTREAGVGQHPQVLEGLLDVVGQVKDGVVESVDVAVQVLGAPFQVCLDGLVHQERHARGQIGNVAAHRREEQLLLQDLVDMLDQGRGEPKSILGQGHQGTMTTKLLDAARCGGLVRFLELPLMIGRGNQLPVAVQDLDVGDDQIVGAAHSRDSC